VTAITVPGVGQKQKGRMSGNVALTIGNGCATTTGTLERPVITGNGHVAHNTGNTIGNSG
jgi:hypothetical protein